MLLLFFFHLKSFHTFFTWLFNAHTLNGCLDGWYLRKITRPNKAKFNKNIFNDFESWVSVCKWYTHHILCNSHSNVFFCVIQRISTRQANNKYFHFTHFYIITYFLPPHTCILNLTDMVVRVHLVLSSEHASSHHQIGRNECCMEKKKKRKKTCNSTTGESGEWSILYMLNCDTNTKPFILWCK